MSKNYCGLILRTSYDKLGDTSSVKMLDKTLLDWVSLAFSGAEYSVADYDDSVALPELCRQYVRSGCDYLVVLFSDTPLITRKTVVAAVDEAYYSSKTVVKMTRGYVFEAQYIKNADKIYTDSTSYFDEEDFITAFSYKQVGLITDIMKNRILDYHMEQGVYFTDPSTTVIGCNVTIEKGVTVGHNNVITGRTRIKKGTYIGNDNVISDSVIGEDVTIESSRVCRSYIGTRTAIGPFAYLKRDNVVGDDITIGAFSILERCRIGDGNALGDYTRLVERELAHVKPEKKYDDVPPVETDDEEEQELLSDESEADDDADLEQESEE